jgi:hypothetical protein
VLRFADEIEACSAIVDPPRHQVFVPLCTCRRDGSEGHVQRYDRAVHEALASVCPEIAHLLTVKPAVGVATVELGGTSVYFIA